MLTVVFFIFALAFSLAHLFLTRKTKKTAEKVLAIFSLYFLTIFVGGCGILGFIAHAFYADEAAKAIGWALGSHFQYQVGMTYLTLGILGLLCFYFKNGFWLATAIAQLLFFLGCAAGNFADMMARHAVAKDNTEIFLYVGDILIPVLLFTLVVIALILQKKKL